MKEERNKTLQQQMTDKYNRFQVVTFAPNIGLTQVMTLNKKVKAQPLSSIGQTVKKIESEL